MAWDGDTPILVVNLDGDFFALEDRCSHEDFELSAGAIDGGQIECTLHGARFDLRSGEALCAPAYAPAAGPDFTPNGNRISPLLELGRGGPFFSSGAAPDLDAVLRTFDPDAPRVHRGRERYAEEEREALRAFLLSL